MAHFYSSVYIKVIINGNPVGYSPQRTDIFGKIGKIMSIKSLGINCDLYLVELFESEEQVYMQKEDIKLYETENENININLANK